jgi:hypothetical protein
MPASALATLNPSPIIPLGGCGWHLAHAKKGLSMSDGAGLATLVLSIDLELGLDKYERQQERRLDEVRTQLVALTRDLSFPVSWAVADPMLSAASESILAAGCGHEIAVLGDQAWLGPGCGRPRLARELARRFSVPRKAGIPVTTLALRNVEHVVDLDLLLEHGVTALCGVPVEQLPHTKKLASPPTRFGIWQPPAAWKLQPRSSWWSPAWWRLRREIKHVIRKRSLLHLRLEAVQLIDASASALDVVAKTLHYIAAKRDKGQLAIQTIGQLASQALGCRTAIPSRSILRPAA